MNWAHIHLALNHIPVLGTMFGLSLLAYAMLRRNDLLKKAACNVFVAVALLALPVYFTGEPAEEVVESTAGISKAAIDAHEQSALLSLVGVELLGVVGLIGLFAAARGRPVSSRVTGTAFALSLATAALMARTANLGGQIHHEEIRAGAPASAPEREIGEAR
jgi:uncharacterized membrane protein